MKLIGKPAAPLPAIEFKIGLAAYAAAAMRAEDHPKAKAT